jgi:hypothetical protein
VYMRCVVGSLVLARFRPDVVEVHEVQDRLFAQVWKNYISVHTSTDRCTGSSRYEYEERRSLLKTLARQETAVPPIEDDRTKWTNRRRKWTPCFKGSESEDDRWTCGPIMDTSGKFHHQSDIWTYYANSWATNPSPIVNAGGTVYCL